MFSSEGSEGWGRAEALCGRSLSPGGLFPAGTEPVKLYFLLPWKVRASHESPDIDGRDHAKIYKSLLATAALRMEKKKKKKAHGLPLLKYCLRK